MPPLTNAQLGAIASELGHSPLALERFGEGTNKGVRFTLRCGCGWYSRNFVLADAAIGAGKEHLRKSVDAHLAQRKADGGRVSLPGSVGAAS